MKKLPAGIQDFRKLITGDYVYIDKTDIISELIENHSYVFLSRPRRFGKSLLVSTLEEIFSGNRELFRGLKIHNRDDWQKHPVIRLDFSDITTTDPESFRLSTDARLKKIAEEEELTITAHSTGDFFSELISSLHVKYGIKVVILIDEYDKPISDHLHDPATAEKMRDYLYSVFVRMKANDAHIRFALLTGVSKFAKMSLFSGINQLTDLSMHDDFANLLGYTQAELEDNFPEHIQNVAVKLEIPEEELLVRIKDWYNGYSWNGSDRVYNPFSILSFFQAAKFENYWFSTGTPSHLLRILKTGKYRLDGIKDSTANYLTFDADSLMNISPKNLLFQTGYLTIKEKRMVYDQEEFILDFPNYEVENSFYSYLLSDITTVQPDEAKIIGNRLRFALEKGDSDQFRLLLSSVFANIPASLIIEEERFFHSIFIMVMFLTGIRIRSEVNTNIGRIDGVIEFSDSIVIAEFKYKKAAETALDQIKNKKYYEPYLLSDKKLIFLGVSFSKNNIEVVTEKLK